MSPEEHLALAIVNPELEEILSNITMPSLHAGADIHRIRAVLADKKKQMLAAHSASVGVSYLEEDQQIPVRDGSSITVRIHRPTTPMKDGSPIFVVYHGGGFCLGGLDSEALLCRMFTQLGGIAVNVAYRLAPEHPFPTPIHDAYDALKWTAANFQELAGNPEKGFLVGGISAGGTFGAIVSHLYRDDKLSPPLTGVYLSVPACMTPDLVPEKYENVYLSREQNRDAPILNSGAMKLFDRLYAPDARSTLRTPMAFELHKGLPPTYFQICGLDPLRDEAIIYEDILRRENGIKTKVDLYPGLPHSFWLYFPLASFSKSFQEDCVKGMQWLLEQSN